MTTIAYAPRALGNNREYGREADLLGIPPMKEEPMAAFGPAPDSASVPKTPDFASVPKTSVIPPGEIEKAVRRMPTLYVIAFFAVVVGCAVMIIWNTLQVNKLTAEKTKLDDQITQSEQRLIHFRAEEMQLSAPDRIRPIAQTKFGMIDPTGQDIVIVK
ncbi:MAG TPA: cell division protein FtsL [Candidatus Kapabacteria bacterium]|jgi:cell division protein FtsL